MGLRVNQRFGPAVACLLWLLVSTGVTLGQEGEQCCPVTRLNFSADAPRLDTTAAVEEWVRSELAAKLGFTDSDQLEVGGEPGSLNGHSIYSLTQAVGGLRVANRESRLILDETRRVSQLLGNHTSFRAPPAAKPSIDPERALAAAGVIEANPAEAQLVFWPDGSDLRLAYEIEGAATGSGAAAFERFYIDASDGSVLDRVSLTPHAFDAAVYDFAAACRDGRIRRSINMYRSIQVVKRAVNKHARTLRSRAGGPDSERLFNRFRDLHQFLESALDLDSYDDRGGQLRGFVGVRFGSKFSIPQCVGRENNAFWHGSLEAVFLPTAGLDYAELIGHEFGHAVVQAGSSLLYRNQSGALNESISDALGVAFRAWVEHRASGTNELPSTLHDQFWRIRVPGTTIRDLSAPASLREPGTGRPYPDHYRDYWYVFDDEGGVHINSSIMNHAFYLLAEGGRHRRLRSGPAVQGIGLPKALKVFGRAATDLLTPNSSFEAARYAFAAVAEILYGGNSPEWVATHTAMDAVGIPGYWNRPPPPPAPIPEPPPEPSDPPDPMPRTEPEELSDGSTEDVDTEPTPPPRPEPQPTPQPDTDQRRKTESPPPSEPRSEPVPRTPQDRDPGKLEPRPPPRSDEVSSSSADWFIYFVLAVLALAAVGYALARLRPGGHGFDSGSPSERGAASPKRVHGAQVAQSRAAPTPVAPLHASVGSLVPQDATLPPIELRTDLLTGPEGLVVGRSARLSHVQIRDDRVSRQHLRLRLVDGAIWVEDLGSTRGTFVEGQPAMPLHPVKLAPDSVLQIADLPYRIRLE